MDKHLHDLIDDLKHGKQTVLFLGTGVNYSPGKKMLWNDVLHEFIKNAIPLLNLPHSDVVELQKQLDPMSLAEKKDLQRCCRVLDRRDRVCHQETARE